MIISLVTKVRCSKSDSLAWRNWRDGAEFSSAGNSIYVEIAEVMNHDENRFTTKNKIGSVKGVNAVCKCKMDGGKMGYEHPFTSRFTSRFTLTERVLLISCGHSGYTGFD